MGIENQELLDQAEELGLKADDFKTEDDLKDAIDDKLADESQDADELREKLKFQKSEAKKAFEARDRAKRDARTLKAKLDEQESKIQELTDKLGDAPDMKTFKEIQAELKEIKDAKEAAELEKLDETEKEKVRWQKQMKELNDKFDSTQSTFKEQIRERDEALAANQKEITNLRKARLGADIVRLAAKYNAYNPEQIEKLLVSDFTYDDKLESFSFLERDTKGKIVDEKTVEERVKDFLEDPINDNLVKSDAKGGTGFQGRHDDSSDKKGRDTDESKGIFSQLNRKTGEYDPKDPKLIAEADDKNLSVEDHIAILKLRDAKMKKIHGVTEDK